MKNHKLLKKTTLLIIFFSILTITLNPVASQITVIVDSPKQIINIGETITIPIIIQDSNKIAGGMIELSFDPKIISIIEVIEGDYGKPIYKIDAEKGTITIAEALPKPPSKNTTIYVYIKIKAIGIGETELKITKAELNDENGNLIYPETQSPKLTITLPPKTTTKTVTLTTTYTKTITQEKTTIITKTTTAQTTIHETHIITITSITTTTETITIREKENSIELGNPLVIISLAIIIMVIVAAIIIYRQRR